MFMNQLHYVGKLKDGFFLTVGGFYVFNGKSFMNLIDSIKSTADFRILKERVLQAQNRYPGRK
jgi:hypothetical protein